MRRIAIGAALAGAGVLFARAYRPKLRERAMAACERMLKQMPDDFPPRRMMRGIEETRVKTARILELLEERERAAGESEESEPLGAAAPTKAAAHAA